MPKVTAIVVGAGLAGLSAAYSLARNGIDVLVVERGDYPGAKNITGGRMYFLPIKNLFPELWDQAPWERRVVREILTMVSGHSSLSIDFRNQKYGETPVHSFTVLASRFTKWFAQKAVEKGAKVVCKYRVDDLIREEQRIKGIIVGGAKIEADVVIAADGIMSQVAEKAGLRAKLEPQNFAVGVKEVITLSPQTIESRFGVGTGEGVAHLFIGSLTRGMMGAGFLYTNHDCVSLGIVLGIKDLAECKQNVTPHQLLEEFKLRPEISYLVNGGESVEYSAHVLSESGIKGMTKLFGDGILLVGDAARMVMNLGLTVRGMEFAIASGALAAEAVTMAKQQNDFSAATLSKYQDLVKNSFIWKDLNTFRHAPSILANPRLFKEYPRFACTVMEKLTRVDEEPKKKLSATILSQLRSTFTALLIRDIFSFWRI